MKTLKNIHPGEILLEEFLIPMKLSVKKLAFDTDMSQSNLSQIIKGNRKITPETAIKLSGFFGNSPNFWLGIQNDYDLESIVQNKRKLNLEN